jgi:hypothetical protein
MIYKLRVALERANVAIDQSALPFWPDYSQLRYFRRTRSMMDDPEEGSEPVGAEPVGAAPVGNAMGHTKSAPGGSAAHPSLLSIDINKKRGTNGKMPDVPTLINEIQNMKECLTRLEDAVLMLQNTTSKNTSKHFWV